MGVGSVWHAVLMGDVRLRIRGGVSDLPHLVVSHRGCRALQSLLGGRRRHRCCGTGDRVHSRCCPAMARGGMPNSGPPAVSWTGLEHWKRRYACSRACYRPIAGRQRFMRRGVVGQCRRHRRGDRAAARSSMRSGSRYRAGSHLIGVHTVAEAPMRPVRIALAGDTGIGDSLPRSRPTFAAWSNTGHARGRVGVHGRGRDVVGGVLPASQQPVTWVVIGCAMTLASVCR